MDKFVSKLSLYDILSMIIPGGTILLFLSRLLGYDWLIDNSQIDSVLCWIGGLALAYIIGIVNHVVSQRLWHPYRNNTTILEKTLKDVKEKECSKTRWLDELYNKSIGKGCGTILNVSCILFLFLMVIFMLFFYMLCIKSCLCKNGCCCVFFMLISIVSIIVFLIFVHFSDKATTPNRDITDAYNTAYYYVAKQGRLNGVSIMEGQVAFAQSMLIPLLMFVFLPTNYWPDITPWAIEPVYQVGRIKFLILLLCGMLFPTVYYRIYKIHYLIWEDYEFLKRIENEESNNVLSLDAVVHADGIRPRL